MLSLKIQQSDLGMLRKLGISRLIRRYGLTQQEAAVKLGKTQSTIANKLRLLRLTYEEQEWIENAGLSERHARALLKLGDEGKARGSLENHLRKPKCSAIRKSYKSDAKFKP